MKKRKENALLIHSDIASSNLRYQAILLGKIHISNKSDNIRCDNAWQNMSVCTKVLSDCANLHIWSVWYLFVNPFARDKLQQRTLASFLRAWICDPLTFTHCICWVSRSSHKNVRHYCNQYFCHICCGRTGPLQSTISVCASSQLTTRGIRTLRNCLSISWWHVCQHSRVLITRRALAVTWETNRNKTNFIVLTPQQIWWGLKRNTLTHSCSHTDDGWTD